MAKKKKQPELKLYCKTDLKTFHAIRRAQKSVNKMKTRLETFQKRLTKIYHTLIENSEGHIRTEVKL